jgi:hypothetical protein
MLPTQPSIASSECSRHRVALSIGFDGPARDPTHARNGNDLHAQFETLSADFPSRLVMAGAAAALVIVAIQTVAVRISWSDRECYSEANNPALSLCRVASPGAVIGVPACTARRS